MLKKKYLPLVALFFIIFSQNIFANETDFEWNGTLNYPTHPNPPSTTYDPSSQGGTDENIVGQNNQKNILTVPGASYDVEGSILNSNNAINNNSVTFIKPDGSNLNSAIFTVTPRYDSNQNPGQNNNNRLYAVISKKPYNQFADLSPEFNQMAQYLTDLETPGNMSADLENVMTRVIRETDPREVTEFIKQVGPPSLEEMVRNSCDLFWNENSHLLDERFATLRLASLNSTEYSTFGSAFAFFSAKTEQTYNRYYGFNRPKQIPQFSTSLSKRNNNFKAKHIFYAKNNSIISPENTWVQFFGNSIKQKDKGNLAGYGGGTFGFSTGIDAKATKFFVVGTNLAYARTQLQSHSDSGNVMNVNNYQVSLYGMYDPRNYFLETILSYGINKYESQRKITTAGINRIAYADYNGKHYLARVRAGYNFYYGYLQVTPVAHVHHSHMDIDVFSERNAQGLNLQNVTYSNISSLMVGAGVRLSLFNIAYDELYVPHYLRNEDIFIPNCFFMIERELNSKKADVSAGFEGGTLTFRNELKEADRTKFNIGIGFTLYTKKNISVLASYNFEYRAHGYGHHGYFKFNYKF